MPAMKDIYRKMSHPKKRLLDWVASERGNAELEDFAEQLSHAELNPEMTAKEILYQIHNTEVELKLRAGHVLGEQLGADDFTPLCELLLFFAAPPRAFTILCKVRRDRS